MCGPRSANTSGELVTPLYRSTISSFPGFFSILISSVFIYNTMDWMCNWKHKLSTILKTSIFLLNTLLIVFPPSKCTFNSLLEIFHTSSHLYLHSGATLLTHLICLCLCLTRLSPFLYFVCRYSCNLSNHRNPNENMMVTSTMLTFFCSRLSKHIIPVSPSSRCGTHVHHHHNYYSRGVLSQTTGEEFCVMRARTCIRAISISVPLLPILPRKTR